MAHTNLDFTASDRTIIARANRGRRLVRMIIGMALTGILLACLALPAAQDTARSLVGPRDGIDLVTPGDAQAVALPRAADPTRAWIVSASN